MAATIVKAGARKPLDVLGMPLTMLCEASETSGNWSLFEEEVPLGIEFMKSKAGAHASCKSCNRQARRRRRTGSGTESRVGPAAWRLRCKRAPSPSVLSHY